MDGKQAIAQFKEWYFEFYGVKPTEKLIERFCKMKGIDIEAIRKQAREEVAKVEEQTEYKVCSVLEDVPTVAAASTEQIPYTEDNFRALETNYHNLLGEFEEVSAIAQAKSKVVEECTALIGTLAVNIGKLLNILDYCKELLSPSDISKLEEIKKEVNYESI